MVYVQMLRFIQTLVWQTKLVKATGSRWVSSVLTRGHTFAGVGGDDGRHTVGIGEVWEVARHPCCHCETRQQHGLSRNIKACFVFKILHVQAHNKIKSRVFTLISSCQHFVEHVHTAIFF